MMKVLIVDDEIRMQRLLKLYLEPAGFKCVTSDNGEDAIRLLEKNSFDLVLLDIMMPELDGWDTAKLIREVSNVPIIMLTARDQSAEMVKGLRIGADDYITKPFDESVLIARIEAVLRRTHHLQKVEFKGLIWDEEQHELKYKDINITLTPIEFEMIGLFLKHQKMVFSRDKLIQTIWGFDSDIEGRTVDSHLRNIREKCRKVNFPIDEHLKTVWGVGYKWE
ncbi:response regulator transcription factor [Chengkuizengella axinellae]|uniref:Response regulator transcription factor n=1 Tax=Chengkuizengella axinellae TaxID=3064388 RepID=A0ABT9J604_9BACL|nr:response regulator transcription factor [Chengkuizengella sp. 2205SS18-9]MDP5277057.1 response regulator transcription factor [Chengkuizengella sp. 2205SS18-9]